MEDQDISGDLSSEWNEMGTNQHSAVQDLQLGVQGFRRIELVAISTIRACRYPDSSREMANFVHDRGKPRTLTTEQDGYKPVEGARGLTKDVNKTLNDDPGCTDSVEGLTETMDKLLESKDVTGGASQMAKTLQSKDFDEDSPICASALWLASQNGCIEAVEALLDQGAPIDFADSQGWTPLAVAAFEGHSSVAKLLVERGANVNTQVSSGATSLAVACGMGHVAVVEISLSNGALIDLADADNWTPLMMASRNNRSDVVALLLARGAQINLKGPNGATALYIACEQGHFPVVQFLSSMTR